MDILLTFRQSGWSRELFKGRGNRVCFSLEPGLIIKDEIRPEKGMDKSSGRAVHETGIL